MVLKGPGSWRPYFIQGMYNLLPSIGRVRLCHRGGAERRLSTGCGIHCHPTGQDGPWSPCRPLVLAASILSKDNCHPLVVLLTVGTAVPPAPGEAVRKDVPDCGFCCHP